MMKINKTNGAEYAPLGIYVHIPFCIRKCKYCDFISFANKSKEEKCQYIDEICEEIKEKGLVYGNKYTVDTIFFGGGTPTVLESKDLIRILNEIKTSFHCELKEISFEANPGTVSKEKLIELRDAGFNRISIGVQSFDDRVLKSLGRIHNSEEALDTINAAISLGFNTNIDLMFGVPNQTLKIWEDSLKQAITLNPNHISFYSLQLEEGTELYNEYRYGDLALPSWEENRNMYHLALDMLSDAAYHHYEISNAAKPGSECLHNMKYWSMDEYLGIGMAAHSYINGHRIGDGSDDIDPKGDFIFTRLRLIDGFRKNEYEERFGISFEEEFAEVYRQLVLEGYLLEENGKLKFTKKGLDYTNPCMEALLNAIKR